MADTPWYLDAANLALSLYGSMENRDAAEKAAKQQAFGTLLANQQQQRQMADLRKDAAPIRQFRDSNLAELSRLNDLQAGQDGFLASPEYQATAGAALGVTPDSGAPAGLQEALAGRAHNIGLGEYGNYYNRRNQYTNLGSEALNSLNQSMQQNSATQQQLAGQYGAELGSGAVAKANATTQGISGLLSLAGNIFGGGDKGSSSGDLLGGGFGGYKSSLDNTMAADGGTYYMDNILGSQYFDQPQKSFSLSDLYSGTGVDSSGSYGYLGDLFSGGGNDGKGSYGLIGDLGGKLSGLFSSGSGDAQSLSLDNLGGYAKAGLTAAGGSMLGNLAGGTVSKLLGGGVAGNVGGQFASAYAKPLAGAAADFLGGQGFNYQAPDFMSVTSGVGGGLAGGIVGGELSKALTKAGVDPAVANIGGQLAGKYVGNYAGQALGNLLGTGTTSAGTTAATTGATATGGATAGASSLGSSIMSSIPYILPIAMISGSLDHRRGEKMADRAKTKAAQESLYGAGLRFSGRDVTSRLTADDIRARDHRELSPEFLAANPNYFEESARHVNAFENDPYRMVQRAMSLDRNISDAQLLQLLDPDYLTQKRFDGAMGGMASNPFYIPKMLVDTIKDNALNMGEYNTTGTMGTSYSQQKARSLDSSNPLSKMMENLYAATQGAEQKLIDYHNKMGVYRAEDFNKSVLADPDQMYFLNRLAGLGQFNDAELGYINQYLGQVSPVQMPAITQPQKAWSSS